MILNLKNLVFFCCLLGCLLPSSVLAKPKQDSPAGPGWILVNAAPVSHAEAEAYYDSKRKELREKGKAAKSAKSEFVENSSLLKTMSLSAEPLAAASVSAPGGSGFAPEIATLARGLKYDPKRIYDYVHNRIDYVPYFGALKGPVLTYLDGCGNDFDQAALFVELLRASGYSAQYVYGQMTIPGAEMANWFGTSQEREPIFWTLGNNGIPFDSVLSDGTATFDRVWVSAVVDGQDYLFDPAFKGYQEFSGIDLEAAMEFDQSALISMALSGASTSADYVQNVNEQNINSELTDLTTNLLDTIRDNYPNKELHEVLGGRKVVESELTAYSDSLPFSPTVTSTWDEIPAEYITTMRIQFFGFDHTFNVPELAGQRLTLVLNSANTQATLRLDGDLVASGSTVGADCVVSIDHPYASNSGTWYDQEATYHPQAGSTYAIVYNFAGLSDARLQQRQRKLNEYLDQGLADTSEAVLGETLNTMGLTYLNEISQSAKMLSTIGDVLTVEQHTVGFVAQEAGYYIDVKVKMTSMVDKSTSETDQWSSFKTSTLFLSAFEHGMLEQLMGSDKPGASTMKLIQLANAAGDKIFHVDKNNIESIKPQLRNYSQSKLNEFTSKVNNSSYPYTYVLPANGEIVLNEWKGSGYLEKFFSADYASMGMIIGGDYYGGYGSSPGYTSPPKVATTTTTNTYNAPSPTTIRTQVRPPAAPAPDTSRDPVDMASGAFLFDSTDLALGGGAPLGLAFSRSYDSGLNRKNRGLGYGWTHNYDICVSETSHGDPLLGNRQLADAAPFIVALYTARDLLKSGDDIQAWVIASLISKWGVDRTIDNAVTVQFGKTSMEFIKMPDGSYLSPPGMLHKLIDNGDGTYTLEERYGVQHKFNSAGQIETITDNDGNVMTFAYSGDKLQTVTDAFNRTLTFGYAGENITSVSDSAGRSVSYTIDASGDLTEYHDAEQKLWKYAYADSDHPHRMTSLTNPENEVTATNTYDYFGQVDTQTVPRIDENGDVYNVTYNLYFSGYRNVEEDPAGNGRIYYYDKKGQRTIAENALGQKVVREFDGQGHIVKVTDHRGNATQFFYDGNQNRVEVLNALNKSSKSYFEPEFPYYLDYSEDPLLHKTDVTYEDGKLKETKVFPEPGETITVSATYYPNGQLWTTTDGRGTVTEVTPDAYGFSDLTWTGGHPAVDYTYDSIGRMADLTDQEGAKTSFVYDDRGLLQTKTDPLQKQTVFTYDDAGRVEAKTDRNNHTLVYAYTPSNKLFKVTYPDNSFVKFTRDNLDNLQYMDDPLGRTSYLYDDLGRITSFTDPNGFTVAYDYDDDLNKVTLTYPGNKAVIYTYDELNRLKYVENWLGQTATYHYDDAGRLDSFQNFNGTVTSYSFDDANRLTGLSASGSAGTITSYTFSTLDGNGNPVVTDQVEPLQPNIAAEAVDYGYNLKKNRLQKAGVQSFGYDNEGQLASGYGETYSFDYEHRLVGVSGASNVQYSYDGVGNRLQAVRDGVTTRYIYDASGNLLAEADGNNTITRYYIHGLGLMALVTPADDLYCYHFNTIGSTVAMTDATQAVVNKYAYDPFGFNYAQDVQFDQPFKFVGQVGIMSESNGFYYMRARYYDPQVGRFISEDPLGFDGGDLNLYAYVGNGPLAWVDPSGLCGLTLSKANKHWREGGGETLIVDIGTLDLSNVSKLPPSSQVKFIGENFSSVNDALVYGTVTLQPGPNNTVVGGFDYYNFDMKPWSAKTFIRNVETWIGSINAGEGTPYRIEFIGTANLGE